MPKQAEIDEAYRHLKERAGPHASRSCKRGISPRTTLLRRLRHRSPPPAGGVPYGRGWRVFPSPSPPPIILVPYDVPRELEIAIAEFVEFYNHRTYHKALKDITPADMLAGRQNEILGRRREVKDRTINRRKLSNQALNEQLRPA